MSTTTSVPDGRPANWCLRADEPFAFATGYFGMPEKTVEAWRNLWFHTGDRVVRDDDGYYRFIDRMKDAIRRRGENISSCEVEQVHACRIPRSRAAAIFPVPSELAEDEVVAGDRAETGPIAGALDIVRYCEGPIAYFAIPRYVRILSEMPMTENGKVQKFKLRERGVTAETWDREAAGVKVRR